jgi:hypothetical protein
MSEDAMFIVGLPQPVTDSRQLPAVTGEQEATFVHGADLGDDHPDNRSPDVDDDDAVDEDLPSEEELDGLVANVDPDDVDAVGFDESDLVEPVGTPGDVRAGG